MFQIKNTGIIAILIMFMFAALPTNVSAQKVKKDISTKEKKKKDKKKKGKDEVEMPVEEAEEKWRTMTNDYGCPMYGEDSVKTWIAASLYQQNYKNKNYVDAIPNWEYVFANSPGFQKRTYQDGEKMFKSLIENAANEEEKKKYFDRLMEIYDGWASCWGESAKIIGKKGLRMVDYYPEEEDKAFDYFEKSIENGGTEVSSAVAQRYFYRIATDFSEKKVSMEDLEESLEKVQLICEANVGDDKPNSAIYQKALDNINGFFEKIEAANNVVLKPSVTDCAGAEEYYGGAYRENPEDKTAISNYYASMIKFRCTDKPEFLAIAKKYNEAEPSAGKAKFIARSYQKQGDFTNAELFYNKAIGMETNSSKKAALMMNLASLYNYKLKQRSKAIKQARAAAELRPGWGDPWILIGNAYAGSASACGGFDGRAAIWAAMDMWSKAKRVDPSSADKAQKNINKYAANTPGKKECFQRNLAKGQSYTVSCLGVSTTVRY